eukprot:TRINITY_DN5916_c0_g1_i18.p1 TRINITY_DN5916_c0_g1~~TRINITY_DN5916_c0_g1_i18.p1  ORF type:complete len:176 (-),score=76.57 TRINITY_DN5916_c0_g1_i18:119-646(-)
MCIRDRYQRRVRGKQMTSMVVLLLLAAMSLVAATPMHDGTLLMEPNQSACGDGVPGCGQVSEHGAALHRYESSLHHAVEEPEDEVQSALASSLSALQDQLEHLDQDREHSSELAELEAKMDTQAQQAGEQSANEQAERQAEEDNALASGSMAEAENEIDTAGALAEEQLAAEKKP